MDEVGAPAAAQDMPEALRLAALHPRQDGEGPVRDHALLELLAKLDVPELIGMVDSLKLGDGEPRSIALYRGWITMSGQKPDQLFAAWYNLGAQLSAAGETAAAATAFRTAAGLKPSLTAAAVNAGLCHETLGDAEGALALWGGALQSDEDRIVLLNHRGRLLESLKRYGEAEQCLRSSLLTDPDQPDAMHHWIAVKTRSCDWPLLGALPGLDRPALEEHLGGLSLLALSDDVALHHRANASWIARKFPSPMPRLSPLGGYAHRKLRIGYLSSDFCQHPMAYLVADLIEQHDRDAFAVYGYCSTKEDGSDVRRRLLAGFDRVTSVIDMTDERAAQVIRDDEIDILIDLNGLTLGTRLPVLRWRPAPVQVTYLGYNGAIPLPELDYIVADRFVIPPSTAARHHPPPLYLSSCYQANDRHLPVAAGETRAAAGLPEGVFVFCCFCNSYKITEEMFEAWIAILHRTENTLLWLYADSEPAQRNLARRFAGSGLGADRLVFASRTRPDVYRARLALADLFLDTYPYNAGTTASDALRVGLPVVTLVGRSFISRMAGSLLHAVGLDEGVVGSLDAYVDLAADLARDPECYAVFREAVSGDAWARTLGDTPKFTREFEAALKSVAAGPVTEIASPAPTGALPSGPMDDPTRSRIGGTAAASDIVAARMEHDRPSIRLFQIVYSRTAHEPLDPGYETLDNTRNERPDWYEYWPIRNYLIREPLDEEAFYGFFSPKFRTKTNLDRDEVVRFIHRQEADVDVVLFSPQPDMGAFFLNVFEQGELFDPGLSATVTQALASIGMPVDLDALVMDARHVVFSNYFAARPRFWREWLRINEALFAICEGQASDLKSSLCHPTTYPGAAQRKVFVQERIASLMLTIQPGWRSVAYNPFDMAWSTLPFREHLHEAFISDALKAAHRDRGYPQYLAAFADVRRRVTAPRRGADTERRGSESGQVFKLVHPSWEADVVVDAAGGRLQHMGHGSRADFHRHGDLILVDWDEYDPEIFRRDGEVFRAVPNARDTTLLDAGRPGTLGIGSWRLAVDSVAVHLPGELGTAHVRPGTSDIPVIEAIFRRKEYDIGMLLPDCAHIVDLGANTGLASIFFANRFPRASVVAVEPAKDNFRLLATNALFRPSIIPVEAAIASRDGQLTLQDRAPSGESLQAWAYRTVDRASGDGGYTVQALSVPTLMRRYGLGFIDVLKVDVEGAEFDLFSAGVELWLPRVRVILVETHERFVPGVDALLSDVLSREFKELPQLGECRVFARLA